MMDIEQFLGETFKFNFEDDFDDFDDIRYMYPENDIKEFSENILGLGCYQKKKKKIYDEDECEWE